MKSGKDTIPVLQQIIQHMPTYLGPKSAREYEVDKKIRGITP